MEARDLIRLNGGILREAVKVSYPLRQPVLRYIDKYPYYKNLDKRKRKNNHDYKKK